MIGKVFSEGPAGEKQPVDAKRVLDLRAIFCIDYHKPECEDAICDCNSKCADAAAEDQCKSKPNDLEFCVRDEEPNCIKDEGSLCSPAVVQCLGEFGKETDVDQASTTVSSERSYPARQKSRRRLPSLARRP
ncbi:hypothetical protein ACQRIT_007471 [Beauveria bassiana]